MYLQPDPIGLGGGTNPYLYALGNPVSVFDFWGLKPGNRFSTIQSAAIDAIDYIHPRSMSEHREYAGWIVKRKKESEGCQPNQDYYYTYDEPTPGGPTGFDYELPQPTDHAGAWYHTHPMIPGWSGEKFSPGDWKYSRDHRYAIGYLGTPTGHILRYIPSIIRGKDCNVSTVR